MIRVSLVHFHPPTMLCAFVHMPAKAAAQNQILHLELRHFARYALMSKKTSAAVQQQQQQKQLDRQHQRTTLQQQRQQQQHQQRRRNHLLLGTTQELLLWVRDKPKPHYIPVHTNTHIHLYAVISLMIYSCLLLITSCGEQLNLTRVRVSDGKRKPAVMRLSLN